MKWDKKWNDGIILALETAFISWFTYAFLYQNYLLYKWHRGSPLPSKIPFVLAGIFVGLAFLAWKGRNLLKPLRENNGGALDERS
ncbi:hypothetical protein PFDSM3638_04670 [Pyrococcus furiosus DSM 3638]|uniref:Uncharacterized protein n=3 Tax=Pyrococcus furiosus TaxID=2261 RepID=A0A5C0XQQ1_PYRFU|nr:MULTISPECIES: hypothetical protein [Pyrococcus]AAL81056.1 hypothetical protein PF0932 [Pyrococcus furiosus DSM 3638]AFN03725.1 hypothetical protein PFC_03880 [Pyrococcus furiosus COM1]MDK2869727.1 hypothetical protein [Pyrococcus sp.]QEK78598.1 hypothetical protein PFDSM3638_04670 [Pyrococcus furiosus DSM 3638]